jgi:hypothetical protein
MKELLEKMAKVNPTRKATGHCLACAGETAKFLLSGQDYDPQNVSETGATSEKDVFGGKKKDAKFDNGDELIKWLQEKVENGTVLIGSDEDHVFNIVKTYEAESYLVDSDLFNVIKLAKDSDFNVTIDEDENNKKPYHYINDREDENIKFFKIGQIHKYWQGKFA